MVVCVCVCVGGGGGGGGGGCVCVCVRVFGGTLTSDLHPFTPLHLPPRSIQSRIDTAVISAEKLWREQHRAEECVKQEEGEVGGIADIRCTDECSLFLE